MPRIAFPPPPSSDAIETLRSEVRAFLKTELADRPPRLRADSWNGFDAAFSRKMGARNWIGMTWPKAYGGHERSALERYVVLEEMLAAGAPVAAHWIADRQSGPLLLKSGTEEQRRTILPRIAAGDCTFCIGMSEPDSGSDLAAVRTRAVEVPEAEGGGWRVNGTKLWTTYAHRADYMILFCRTDGGTGDRQGGTSQLLVDLKATPGVTIRPILDLSGAHHFNEVVFEDARLPADALIGERGEGWKQVMSELAYERSGPERFLSSMALLTELVRALGPSPSGHAAVAVGRLAAHLIVLRRLSRSVAGMLDAGENPALQASLVKDLGALFEQEIPEIARQLVDAEPDLNSTREFSAVLAHTVMNAPAFSLRGGTREILRGIIARGLGLR
jgi:alkylation response protein AidB-like acyl-CoA dehydrogenase